MITLHAMGRKKLGRVTRNITLPRELAEQADLQASYEGRPLSHLVEEVLRLYLNRREKKPAKESKATKN